MEAMQNSQRRRNATLHNDPDCRLESRSGGVFEGYTTKFSQNKPSAHSQSKTKSCPRGWTPSSEHDPIDEGAADEMDLFSGSDAGWEDVKSKPSKAAKTTPPVVEVDYTPSYLKNGGHKLKFNKNKGTNAITSKETTTALKSSQPRQSPPRGIVQNPPPKPSRTTTMAPKKARASPAPVPGPSRRPTRRKSNAILSPTASSAEEEEEELPQVKKPGQRKKPSEFPMKNVSPISKAESMHLKRSSSSQEVICVDTPTPVVKKKKKKTASSSYPVLSPLCSQEKQTRASGSSSKPDTFPNISPLGNHNAKANGKANNPIACLSPLAESNGKAQDPTKDPKPHPMSTQIMRDLYSSPQTPTKGRGKRSSDGSSGSSDREPKRRRQGLVPSPPYSSEFHDSDDEHMFLDPSVDPKTLCPYCDSPLPTNPTPLFMSLLESTKDKSKRDPRPTNPLGRKAPVGVFISLCQRHKFESQILPEAERRGWPKDIKWMELEGRVKKMRGALRDLIEDPGALPPSWDWSEIDEWDECTNELAGLKMRCVFWRETMKEVKKKGANAVAGIRNQFATFEKSQPGYYGEQGSVIIHQTLYNLFPPSSIDPSHTKPLTPSEFLQRILVPEVGLRLIMEDQGLFDYPGVQEALKIMRESSSYGVAMFPEDGGEWDVPSKKGKEKLGVADRMVMARAKKRRQELEAEEKEEEEQFEKDKRRAEKEASRKGKGKERELVSDAEMATESRPKPRPKPRPRNVTAPTMGPSPPSPTASDSAPSISCPKPKPRAKPKSNASTVTLSDADASDASVRSTRRAATKNLDLRDLSSDSESDAATDFSRKSTRSQSSRCLPIASSVPILHIDSDAEDTPRPLKRKPKMQSSESYPLLEAQKRIKQIEASKKKTKYIEIRDSPAAQDRTSSWLLDSSSSH